MRVYLVSYVFDELMEEDMLPFAVTSSLTLAMKAVRTSVTSRGFDEVRVVSHHVPAKPWEYASFPDEGIWLLSFEATDKDEITHDEQKSWVIYGIQRYDVVDSPEGLLPISRKEAS